MGTLNLFLLSIVVAFSPSLSGKNNFITLVNDAYSKFVITDVTDDEYENYQLVLVSGEFNNEKKSGIYFFDNTSQYQLYVTYNDEYYFLDYNEGFNASNVAIDYQEGMQAVLVNKENKKAYYFDFPSYNESSTFTIGNGNGAQTIELVSINQRYQNQLILYIVLGVIITASLIILVILRATHSGLFAKEKRREGVFNMKDFLMNTSDESNPFDPLKDVQIDKNASIIEGEIVEDENNEKKEKFDIKKYLIDKGYAFDYSDISEDEKNKIMIELMILKKNGNITEEEYKKETIKLWKK